MADHLRQQIRDAVMLRLRLSLVTRAKILASRRYPLQADDLPAVLVYTVSETSELMDMGPSRLLKRELEIAIEAVVQVVESLDDRLDDRLDALAADIEQAMASDASFGGLAYDSVLVSSQMALQPAKDSELKTGSVAMIYRAIYRSTKADASVAE